ncbi:glycoside hydrolase domain-containing protein [Entomoplasma freundtii]|nr:glycoside hydrolase domain-containing protein [Entomoplasma freundtii]
MKSKKTGLILMITLFLLSILIASAVPITINFLSLHNDWDKVWKKEYDYQEGTKETTKPKKPANEYVDYFFGDSLFKNDSFYEKNNTITYNGDWSQVKKTTVVNKDLICWKNDFQSKQLILFKINNNTIVKGLEINIKPLFNNFSSVTPPTVKVQFIKPIKARNNVSSSSIYKGTYYSFDEISTDSVLKTFAFPMQPILLSATTNNETTTGTFNYEVNINFKVNNELQLIQTEQKVVVVDKNVKVDNYGSHDVKDFGYESMIFSHNSQKFISKNWDSRTLAPTCNNDDLVIINNPSFDWNGYHYLDERYWFLKDDNVKGYEKWVRDCVDSLNMSYGYFTDFGLPYLKMIIQNHEENPNDLKSIEILNNQKGLEDLISNPNLSLQLSFEIFDKFVDFFKNSNYTKIYIPAIIRNNFNIALYYSSKNYPLINNRSPLPQVIFHNRFIDGKGFLTREAKVFYNDIFPKYLNQLAKHINNKIDSGEYLNFKGEPLKFFFSFDETKYEVNKFVWDIVQKEKLDNLFGSHVYAGWEYKVQNRSDQISTRLIDNWDELTLNPLPFLAWDNGKKIKEIINQRKTRGLITRFYSTWGEYPGSYLGSNPAESYWGPLLARSVNANGWHKFQLDGFRNDISLDNEDTSAVYEPGDAYQLYPGSGDGPNLSLRLVNFIESIKTVWKLNQLQKEGKFVVSDLLKNIKLTKNANQNTPYKWNLNYWNWTSLEKMNLKKDLRVSEQTEFVKIFIYEYTRNNLVVN